MASLRATVGHRLPTTGSSARTHHRTGAVKADPYDNKPNETMYFYTDNDSQMNQLGGKSSYAVTFPKGQLPPVKGFWSTMYNPERAEALRARHEEQVPECNPDGSLTIYFGTTSPGKDKESNWLPAPVGKFSIWLRCYWPDQAILDGTWTPPTVSRMADGESAKLR